MHILPNAVAALNRAIKQKQLSTLVQHNKLTRACLGCLINAGFLSSYTVLSAKHARIYIKFDPRNINKTVAQSIKLISRPGNRKYIKLSNVRKKIEQTPLSWCLISTSKGLKFFEEAQLNNVGGELLLIVN